MPTVTADQLDEIRRESLAAAVTSAEAAHQHIAESYPDAPSRETAIAAVITEAVAYWRIETTPGNDLDDYREIAELLAALLAEQARSIVFALLPATTRRQAYARVVSDIYGPGDDDSPEG
jgi:hypothetical protein